MTQLTATARPEVGTDPRPWRWAGALALAHVVVMLAALSQEVLVAHGDPASSVQAAYAGASLPKVLVAGYVEALAFLLLVPAIVLLARLLGTRSELGRVAALCFQALGTAYVASTFAVGFPPAAAAVYAAHHGVDPGAIAVVNDVRNYGFVLQVALLSGMTLALGIAALADRVHRRVAGWGGVVLGGAGILVVPVAYDLVSVVWLAWWVALAVLLLRGAPAPLVEPVVAPEPVG